MEPVERQILPPLTPARLIIRHPRTYSHAKVREAAVWMLGCDRATQEDQDEAAWAIGDFDPDPPEAA